MNQQEFFTVHHALTINIEILDEHFTLPSFDVFEQEVPVPFIVASDFNQLDLMTEGAKQELKNSDFKHLIQLLDAQNGKLNLLLTFMLSQQDDANTRTHTLTFGASQFSIQSDTPLNVDQKVRAKLFVEQPAGAIYCYASVSECKPLSEGYEVTFRYDMLRDSDQDLLIKAALCQQQKLLRQRSLDRDSQ